MSIKHKFPKENNEYKRDRNKWENIDMKMLMMPLVFSFLQILFNFQSLVDILIDEQFTPLKLNDSKLKNLAIQ